MDSRQKRQIARFLKVAEPFVDFVGLVVVSGFFLSFLPVHILGSHPATGGDTGSHYWTLHYLVNEGLPHFTTRIWNPGNQLGEPRLVHYFPLPFLVMAGLSFVVPIGTAFNIGTLLGVILLPVSIYFFVRCAGFRFPAPLLAASSSLGFLYAESFSMWGGNVLSTLAGQFAHGYSLSFLCFASGMLLYEIRKRRGFLLSALCFAATVLSHGYPALAIPFVMILTVAFYDKADLTFRVKHCFGCCVFTLLLCLWFLVPRAENAPWTTDFSFAWAFSSVWSEVFPVTLYPHAILFLLFSFGALWSVVFNRRLRPVWLAALSPQELRKPIAISFALMLLYTVLFFVLPKVGLIDIRTIPQILLTLAGSVGLFMGICLRRWSRLLSWFLTLPLLILSLWWADTHVEKAPGWLEWNYSGWTTKSLHKDLTELSEVLRGSLSDPRVLFELSARSSGTGTVRVFEMLPYFAGRATLESVYLEATKLSPYAVYMQALVSKFPSCPFQQYKCVHYDVERAKPLFELLGVGAVIVVTEEVAAQARASSYLEEVGTFGPWHLFRAAKQPKLVEVLGQVPEIIEGKDWSEKFYEWFGSYTGKERFLMVGQFVPKALRQTIASFSDVQMENDKASCHPEISLEFNRINLKTDCPGRLHYLKFNYHPAWKTDSGDPILLISPGFLAVVPSKTEVSFVFGQKFSWQVSAMISWLSLIVLLGCEVVQGRKG